MHIFFRGGRNCDFWLRLTDLFLNERRLMMRGHDLVQGDVLVVLLFGISWLALVPLAACSHLLGVRSFVIFAA
jgi:hypothetical protein